MDVTNLAAAATTMAQTRTADAVSTAVFKKTLDIQAQGAMQLLEAATQTLQTQNNPPHLGQYIDTFA